MKTKKPIKQPVQARAKLTRERILSVSKEMIQEGNIKLFTTNRVAEKAFISVATLYQYFPNKEAILDELIAQYLESVAAELQERIGNIKQTNIRDTIKIGLMQVVNLFHETEQFFLSLASNYNNPLSFPGANKFEISTLKIVETQLISLGLNPNNINASIFVIYHACMAVLSKHFTSPKPAFSDEVVVEELAEMICAYMKLD